MPITRHFLGWDGPALVRAAAYLHEHFGQGEGGWDLSNVLAVVPAQRAGRRLLELLVTQAQDQPLVPPRIVTAGGLPELAYQPARPLADELDVQLAWTLALRTTDPGALADLLPNPPKPDDLTGWWALAKQLRSLGDDLAGHRMGFADVPRLCAQSGVDLLGEQRWDALTRIEKAYRKTLDGIGLTDKHTARLDAINESRCALDEKNRIVLIAAVDLNDVAAAMLHQIGDQVTALIMAPDDHRDGFDDLGVLIGEYWTDRHVPIEPKQLRFVDKTADQARELTSIVAQAANGAGGDGPGLSADHISVGLGDERFAGPVQRALDLASVPSRRAAGTPTIQSRPAMLLRALGRFMEHLRYDALAELLRHPDVEAYLYRADNDEQDTREGIDNWLTLLDTYAARHLQGTLTGAWLGNDAHRAQLKALWDKLTCLLPTHPAQKQPLPAWSQPIAQALRIVYSETHLDAHDPDDHLLGASLEMIAELLREQAALDPASPTCPELTASQAIALTLSRLADQSLADEGGEPAVEMLGYLELALDDAPVLIITGMNEGLIPASRTADAFLPDSVRSALSMHDNAHRHARDLMLLTAIIHSRPNVALLAARRTDDGDPQSPSRLLLACQDDILVQRVRAFFNDGPDAPPPPLPLEPGGDNRFLIPPPLLMPRPINRLSVTAFRSYLACPYRFYLRYVMKLRVLDDRAVEMDPLSFGVLAHDVLQAFGAGEAAHATDPDDIADCLNDQLDKIAGRRFGKDQRPAVRIQIEQLRQRLARFALKQAELTQAGWRIQHVERELEAEIEVDGQPFTITGKIDRIDRHDTLGYRVFDYKTGDSALAPDKTHRASRDGQKVWVDLQLPLYRDLCGALGVAGPVELGYINLPKTLKDVGPAYADWDEDDLEQAQQTRNGVIRGLREQRFWPPQDSPRYPDGLERICADSAIQRQALIQASAVGGADLA